MAKRRFPRALKLSECPPYFHLFFIIVIPMLTFVRCVSGELPNVSTVCADIQIDTNFVGYDSPQSSIAPSSIPTSSVADCCTYCGKTLSASFFSFDSNTRLCFCKTLDLGKELGWPGWFSGTTVVDVETLDDHHVLVEDGFQSSVNAKGNGGALVPKRTMKKQARCWMEVGYDYAGFDLRNSPSDGAELCCDICASETDCLFFTYDSNSMLCYRKTSNAGRYAIATGISGFMLWHTHCTLELNVLYMDPVLRSSLVADVQSCCDLCASETDCTYFTFNSLTTSCARMATHSMPTVGIDVISGKPPVTDSRSPTMTHTLTATATSTSTSTPTPTLTSTPTLTPTPSLTKSQTNTATRTHGQVWQVITVSAQAPIPSGWRQATLAEMAILGIDAMGYALTPSSVIGVVGGTVIGSNYQTNNNQGFEAMDNYPTTGDIWIVPDWYRCSLPSTIYRIVGESNRCSMNSTTMQDAGCPMDCPDGFYGTAVPRCHDGVSNFFHILIEGVCRETPVEYNPVFVSNSGIGTYDLADSADVAFGFDFEHTGQNDYLGLYRPGAGAFHILKNNNDGTFIKMFDAVTNGVDGYTLYSPYARPHVVLWKSPSGQKCIYH